ncbi:MAG: preprotein translocase subunit SecG [Chloroflexi bacterium]|nr:preprotein translocase subunit SecG [Chloroflexota bacterium]
MAVYFNIAQIIVAVVLTLIILLQAKGSGFSGVFGGGDTSVFRTRRGVEKTLFQLTIVLAVLFILLSMVNVRLAEV